MKTTLSILTLLQAITVAVFISFLFEGCYSRQAQREPVQWYRVCELKEIQKVELGFYIYWKDAGSPHWYEPIFAPDTTGMHLYVGMQSWVAIKR